MEAYNKLAEASELRAQAKYAEGEACAFHTVANMFEKTLTTEQHKELMERSWQAREQAIKLYDLSSKVLQEYK